MSIYKNQFIRATSIVFTLILSGCSKDDPAPPTLPTVSTIDVSTITTSGAFAEGEIVTDGGTPVTKKGFVWGTSPAPSFPSPNFSEETGSALFFSSISGLTSKTTYYLRAYAINKVGTAYGKEITFKTLAKPAHFIVTSQSNFVTDYNRPAILVTIKNDGESTGYNVGVDINALQGSTIIDKGTAFPADLGDILPGQSAQDDAVFFKLTPSQVAGLTFSTPVITWLTKN